jgi:hypothetical protein
MPNDSGWIASVPPLCLVRGITKLIQVNIQGDDHFWANEIIDRTVQVWLTIQLCRSQLPRAIT